MSKKSGGAVKNGLSRAEKSSKQHLLAEDELEITVEFLRLVNEARSTGDLVRAAATFFQQKSGCEVLGIRLKQGEDYPYYIARGFSPEFLERENHLCARCEDGKIVRDRSGLPIYECVCGNVVCGRSNPSMPFYSAKGSFWTNSTSELVKAYTEDDFMAKIRGRCVENFESVAVICIRMGGETLGLLHIDDRRKGMFSPEIISRWERLADQLAVALAKFRAEDELRRSHDDLEVRVRERTRELGESERRFRATFEQAAVGIAQIGPDGRFIRINERYCDIVGYTHDEIMERTFQDITYHADLEESKRNAQRLLDGEITTYTMEKRYVRKDDSLVWVNLTVSLERNEDGTPKYLIAVVEDITERKRAEEALRESEERFRQLADNSPIPIAINDKDDNITYLNRKFIEIFGYTLEDIPRLSSWWPRAYPDPVYREEAIKRWEKGVEEAVRESKDIGPIDYIVTCKDGSVRYVEVSGAPIGDKELVLLQDVTERKQAEEDRENVLHRLGERVKELNALHNVARIFQKQSTIPMLLQEIVSILPPAWQYPDVTTARVTYDGNDYRTKNFIEGRWRQNAEFVTSNGKKGEIEIFYIKEKPPEVEGPFLAEERNLINSLAEMLRIYLDRKRAEEALIDSEANLAMAQSIARLGNYSLDIAADWARCSDEFYRILGLEPQDHFSFKQFLSLVHPEDRELVDRKAHEAWDNGKAYNIENRMVRPDGEVRIIYGEGNVIVDETGRTVRMFGIIQDITERKIAEEEIKTAKEQAELYLDLMGHDINNMHQIALGYLELARDMPACEGQTESLLDKPIEVLQRSARLIRNVRKLQKLKEDVLETQVVDTCQLLVDVQREFGGVPHKAITMNLNGCEQCLVHANELLHDVFANLLGNAIKHTGDWADINIGLDIVNDKGSRYCRVMVEDDGPGIADDFKRVIFNRVLKGMEKAKGMGLGLYLVKSLVESYGGRVWVEDRVPGDHTKGARFVVMLPAVEQ